MKIKFGCKCIGVIEAETEIRELPDNTTTQDIECEAREFATDTLEFDFWWEKL